MKGILVICTLLVAIMIAGFQAAAGKAATDAFSSAASIPEGSSPRDALSMICNWVPLPAASNAWYKVPQYGTPELDQNPLLIRLVAYPSKLEGMEFKVYAGERVGNDLNLTITVPIGYSQSTDLLVVKEWTGTPVEGETYYVDVINNNLLTTDYGLCDPYRRMSVF